MASRKTSHVVMLSSTYDANLGDVVAVTPEQAEELVANKHARPVEAGEVKESKGS